MTLRAGVRLGDRYELVGRIAAGGMGEVWRARDTTLLRTVAVKVLRSEYTCNQSFLARFRTEARNAASLSHPNIAPVHDYGEAMAEGEHVAFLVMELIDGDPLSDVLAQSTRLDTDRLMGLLAQTAAGLGEAHRNGVVHRDVKPANLMIRPDQCVKITDFGISRAADHVPLTGTGMVVGTAAYLSPEQAMGREVTPASDVYSLGVVGYQCLAGRLPFEGESSIAVALAHVNQAPPPLPTDVPEPVRAVIMRAMSKDAAERFPDGAHFVDAIREVCQEKTSALTLDVDRLAPSGTKPTSPVSQAAPPPGDQVAAKTSPAAAPTRIQPQSPVLRARRRRLFDRLGSRPTVPLLIGLALALAVGLIAVYLVQQNASSPALAGDSVKTSAEPELVLVDTTSYVGRPIDEVEADLTALGLVVVPSAVDVSPEVLGAAGIVDQPFAQGAVLTTDPRQVEVPMGSTVTVSFAEQDYVPAPETAGGTGDTAAPGGGPGSGGGAGGGNGNGGGTGNGGGGGSGGGRR